MDLQYYVFDIETTIRNRGDEAVGNFQASPYHTDNKICMFGYRYGIWNPHRAIMVNTMTPPEYIPSPPPTDTIVVGHNLAFDLSYLILRSDEWRDWARTGIIWDTMIAEYLITGQQSKWASLDSLSVQYGGTVKDFRIREYWTAGIDTTDIPAELLEEYCKQDVLNTERVFLAQLSLVDELGMAPLVGVQMDARLATLEMELNGMYVETDILASQKESLQKDIDNLTEELEEAIVKLTSFTSKSIINLDSPKFIGTLLFGGDYEYSVAVPTGLYYKSGARKGEEKYKKETRVYPFGKLFNPVDGNSVMGKNGWGVGHAVLSTLYKTFKSAAYLSAPSPSVQLLEDLLKYRELKKDMSAYYVGYGKLLWPGDILHPSYNHVNTDTGRLSCSHPNLQQVSGK